VDGGGNVVGDWGMMFVDGEDDMMIPHCTVRLCWWSS